MIIDFHTHCFPEKIADRAMEILRKRSGIVIPTRDGTINGLVELQKHDGIDLSVVLNIATNPHQQKNVNDFAISLKEVEGVIPFGSVHPDSPDALEELERLSENGIKGVKLHPDYQEFFVDDDKMLPIYEKIGKLGLITVFHCGIDMGYPVLTHCTAKRLAEALPAFGGSPVVAAHMGGVGTWEETKKYLVGKDVYFDTAYSYGVLPPLIANEIIAEHGFERVLFASDSPWNTPGSDLGLVKCLDLPEEQEKAILGGNAEKLLKLN